MTADHHEYLTATESARYRVARAAASDFRDALDSGEGDDRQAATAALAQSISQLDPTTTRDKLHIPDDAGEYENALRSILTRIPDGWGRWISCDRGWFPIVVELDQQLAAVDRGYRLLQVKEKWGELAYYYRASDGTDADTKTRMHEIVAEAASQCAAVCEACGSRGATLCVGRFSWHKTLCPLCAVARGYEPLGEIVEELSPRRWRGTWSVTTAEGDTQVWDLARSQIWWHDGESYSTEAVLSPPRVNGIARILMPDGTERVSGSIAEIRRIR